MTEARPVRTRFAPSPTGPLHIGSARTALFTWLLARHYGGQFILRIEDTDQKRYIEGSLQLVTDGLQWLGLDWDEGPDKGGPYGPYTQSQRLDLYQQWANWLVEQGKAYRAYDTREELSQISAEREAKKLPPGYDGRHRELTPAQEEKFIAEGRKPVIRFKAPDSGKTIAQDLVRGEVEFDNSTISDMILLKEDGFPTYHLAHIIDDHLMEISHVTRSIEWLPSLPLHYQLWQAFGWEMPVYAHLPVLLNPNGKGKLSKRHAGFSEDGKQVLVLTKEFQEAGYYAPAVVNFLTNIGWNFGDEREVFSVEEAIARFDGTGINPANSVYPIEKLDWLNGVYIREKMSDAELAAHLRTPLERAGLTVDDSTLLQIVPIVRTRIKIFNDVVDLAGFFFREDFSPPSVEDLIPRKMDAAGTLHALEIAHAHLSGLSSFAFDHTEPAMRALAEELGLKAGQLFGALRVAVTAQSVSPPLFETMEILGKAESLRRIQLAIDVLAKQRVSQQ
ncbi:MAG: glutamate--tRNA ligase [Anaerolineae bacterium]|nr:glutamate--tRNA ligase [Anaerolineae bacterium]